MNEENKTSRQNHWLKKIQLWQKRFSFAKEENIIICEGEHIIVEALKSKKTNYKCLVVFSNLSYTDFLQRINEVYKLKVNPQIEFYTGSENQLKSISSLDSPVKMLAIFQGKKQEININSTDDVIILNALQDAGNVGTIMRTALVLGINNILSTAGGVSLWHPKVLRSAQGAHFHLQLADALSYDEIIKIINKHSQTQLMLADMQGSSMFLQNLQSPKIWVFGSEGHGINCEFEKVNHQKISVPMPQKFDSLNVAISASLLLYEQYRQRVLSTSLQL